MRYFFIALIALLTCSTASLSQEPNEDEGLVLDTVTVVGSRVPRPVADVAGSVTVISNEQLERELVTDLEGLVNYQPGLSIETAGSRFAPSGINIRGVGGNRVKVEFDGVPVADHFQVGSFSHAGRDGVDPEYLSRVEILRGPASSLYGSDAIGGVVSMVSMRPHEYLARVNEDRYFGLKTNVDSRANGWLLHGVAAAQANPELAFSVAASVRGFEHPDNQSNLPDAKNDLMEGDGRSILAQLNGTGNSGNLWGVTVDAVRRDRSSDTRSILGSGRYRSTTLLTGDDKYTRSRISANYRGPVASDTDRRGSLYYQETDVRQFTVDERAGSTPPVRRERLFNYDQQLIGADFVGEYLLSGQSVDHRLVYGVDIESRRIRENRDAVQINLDTGERTNVILGETFPVSDFPNSRVNEVGVFIQDEISAGGAWTLIPALRFDYYDLDPGQHSTTAVSVTDNAISPKLGIIYDISRNAQWFAHYAHGFRAPPFNDVNLTLDIPLFNIRALPNPDLESEKSDTLEWGIRSESLSQYFELSLFYSRYRDFIETNTLVGVDPDSGQLLFQSINLNRARIGGVEARWHVELGSWADTLENWYFDAGVFWADGENRDNGQSIDSLDPANMVAGLGWRSGSDSLDLRLLGRAYQSKDDVADPAEQFQPPGYAVFDILGTWQPSDSVRVDFGLLNLADRKYWRWQSVRGLAPGDPVLEVLSSSGRSVSVGLRLDF